ncbi:MAG TPA: sensor domain-containing diguanylate cyclase [bacterium]|nr:sensor domain-containing diguanylate cyclase [bacterium]
MNEDQLLEEFSRMNNELIDARRELSRVHAALEERERFLAKVLELSPFIVYVYDLERGTTIYESNAITSILGFGANEIKAIGDESFATLLHPEDRKRFAARARILRKMGDGKVTRLEYRVRDKSGVWHWHRLTDTVFERKANGEVRLALGTVQDISEEKSREALLKEASRVDELTGLHNRRSFGELADQHLRGSMRRNERFAILFFDLDHFKSINDRHGHAEGDEALRAAATILDGCFRADDIVARYGGDEFVALLSQANAEATASLVDRVRQAADAWNSRSGRPWRLEFSTGMALFDPASPQSMPDLMDRADKSMYRDKRDGAR